jgi:flagellar protein FliS
MNALTTTVPDRDADTKKHQPQGIDTMFTSVHSRAASAYKRVAAETSVQTADPHTLVGLLYDALLQSIAEARGAMARGDTLAKGAALGKAVRILEEGLKAGLNLRDGGEIAANLRQLYAYSTLRLTQANLRNDAKALEEVSQLIEPIAQSWKQIRGPGPAYLQPVTGRGA